MEQCGGCARKCKRVGGEEEVALMSAASRLLKRMRTRDSRETELISENFELQSLHFPVASSQSSSGVAPGDSGVSDCSDRHSLTSSRCSSSDESREAVDESFSKSTDPEAKSPESVTEHEAETETETESSTSINSKSSTRETAPASAMEPQAEKQPPKIHRKRPSPPPSAEIEEFFSAAEKRERDRFAERYNFDVAKDVPLEGRYQWVRLKKR